MSLQSFDSSARPSDSRRSSSVSTSLLNRMRTGDAEAWRSLVQLFGPKIYQWCRAAGLQPADAADVGQEVFRAAATGLMNFRRDRPGDTFSGWLWQVTQYKLRDHWRAQARQPNGMGGSAAMDLPAPCPDEPASTESGSPPSEDDLLPSTLDAVKADFLPRTWQAFWLLTVEQWTAAEVAEHLEMSRGAVYVAKSRVLRRLREELDGLVPLNGSPPPADTPPNDAE